jgi:hypothetical protein
VDDEDLGGVFAGKEEEEEEIDSFALESTASSSSSSSFSSSGGADWDELYVFKSTSRRASESYLRGLECLLSRWRRRRDEPSPRDGDEEVDVGRGPSSRGNLRPNDRDAVEGEEEEREEDADCSIGADGGGHVRRLDRCLYDTGSAASGRDCPPSARTDVRVARFRGFSADANGDVGDHPRGGPENSAEYQGCGTPWEYPSEERCSNDHLGRNAGRRRTLARKSRSLD